MLKNKKFQSFAQAIAMISFSICWVCLCFYPGTSNNDSQWQLEQANNNEYFDAHPPVMSYLWHWLNEGFPATHGNANMFLFFALTYCFALTLIAFAEQTRTTRRWAFMGMTLLFPPALLIVGFVIKDSLMAVNLLLAYAFMIHAEQKRSGLLLFLSIFPLFIGFSARHNSIFAVIPVCVWFGYIVYSICNIKAKPMLKHSLSIGMGLLLFSGLFIVKDFFATHIVHVKKSHTSQFILTYDLVGVSVRAKENWLPSFYDIPGQPVTEELLKKIYRPYTSFYIFWPGNPGDPTLPMVSNADQEKQLLTYWIEAVKKHPKEMFLHKVESFFSSLGLLYPFAQLKANELSSPVGVPWSKVIPSSTMNGWIYLLVLTIFMFFPLKLKGPRKVLFYSGYLYGLSWILATPNTEQRYFFWVIMSCSVLMTGLFISKIDIIFAKIHHLKNLYITPH